jgi:hypothetical protein
MAILTLNIDRITDIAIVIVKCYIDNVKIAEDYFIDPLLTDIEINNYIKTDLQNKGYIFE